MRRIRLLVGAQCLGLLTLLFAVCAGTHFHAGKLKALSAAAGARLRQAPAYDASGRLTSLEAALPVAKDLRAFAKLGVEDAALLCSAAPPRVLAQAVPAAAAATAEPADAGPEAELAHLPAAVRASFATLESAEARARCWLWKSMPHVDLSGFEKLITWSRGWMTPDYPLRKLSHNLFCTLIGNVSTIVLAWAHSLTLPQPLSMVHAPRLVVYAVVDVWRILFLYALKTLFEAIPAVQQALRQLERYVASPPPAGSGFLARQVVPRLNGFSPAAAFDSSDHIVLYSMLAMIVMSELVCMVTHRRSEKKAIDNPFSLKKRGIVLLSSVNLLLLALLLYNTFVTSVYFHTPLEVWLACLIALFGLYLPFWICLVFLDSLNFYF